MYADAVGGNAGVTLTVPRLIEKRFAQDQKERTKPDFLRRFASR